MQSRVKDILFKVGTAVVCVLAYAMSSRLESATARPTFYCDPQENWYGLTAKTISRSSMWSSDKLTAIKRESAKFADTFQI